jgi:hypothetical protein
MVTVFWNPTGLDVNNFLETGTLFNSAHFSDYVFSDIESLPALQTAAEQKKKFAPCMDNSRVHKSFAVINKVASRRFALAPRPRTRRISHRLISFSLPT